MSATFVTDVGTALALSAIFIRPNARFPLFLVASIAVILVLPRIAPWFFGRYGDRVIEPEIKLVFVARFVFMVLADRRPAIHASAVPSAAGSRRQVRTRPTFSERTSPLASRTWRCCITAGNDMTRGWARAVTEAGPRLNRSTITRRAGSASAWNRRSSGADWLSTRLSITID
jgi:hypothetical protein